MFTKFISKTIITAMLGLAIIPSTVSMGMGNDPVQVQEQGLGIQAVQPVVVSQAIAPEVTQVVTSEVTTEVKSDVTIEVKSEVTTEVKSEVTTEVESQVTSAQVDLGEVSASHEVDAQASSPHTRGKRAITPETVLDVASAGYSGYQLVKNPTWGNAGMLVWDVAAAIIPAVPGSYVARAANAASDVASSTKNTGRAKNHLKYDSNATGDHSTFKRDPQSGEITNWATWHKSDPRDPNPFKPGIRFDSKGESHYNKKTGIDVPPPHIRDMNIPGGIRPAKPDEIPGKP